MSEYTSTKPELPLPGDDFNDAPDEIVIASMWSTEEPDEDGAYTAHVFTMANDVFWVGLWQYDEEEHEWAVEHGRRFASIGPAARFWTEITGDD